MRRVELIALLALLCTVLGGRAQDKVYVYGKDGNIESFFLEKIDSITYSRIDTAGILHEDFVTQLIHQTDTVYKVPIASIDSVSFIDPPVEYNENVVQLTDDFWSYVKEIKEKTIYASADLPTRYVPQKGQVLVYPSNNVSQYTGFSGIVEKVVKRSNGSYDITVSIPSLTDIFKNLVIAEKIDFTSGLKADLSVISFSDNYGIHGSIALNDIESWFSNINTVIDKSVLKGFSYTLKCTPTIKFGVSAEINTEKIWEPIKIQPLSKDFPIPQTGYLVAGKIYFYIVPEASGNIDMNWEYGKTYVMGVELKNGVLKRGIRTQNNTESLSQQIDLEGSIYGGLRIQLGLGASYWDEMFGIEGNVGVKYSGNFSIKEPTLNSHAIYSNLKKAKLSVEFPWQIGITIPEKMTVFYNGEDSTGIDLPSVTGTFNLKKEWYIVPDFTQPNVTSLDEYYHRVQVTSTASRQLLFPCKIALALSKGDQFLQYGASQDYNKSDTLKTLSAQFTGLEENTEYNITPCMSLWGETFQTDISTKFKTLKEQEPNPDPTPSTDLVGKWVRYENFPENEYHWDYELANPPVPLLHSYTFYANGTFEIAYNEQQVNIFQDTDKADFSPYTVMKGIYTFDKNTGELKMDFYQCDSNYFVYTGETGKVLLTETTTIKISGNTISGTLANYLFMERKEYITLTKQ